MKLSAHVSGKLFSEDDHFVLYGVEESNLEAFLQKLENPGTV